MENVAMVSTLLALRGDDGQRGGSTREFNRMESGVGVNSGYFE